MLPKSFLTEATGRDLMVTGKLQARHTRNFMEATLTDHTLNMAVEQGYEIAI